MARQRGKHKVCNDPNCHGGGTYQDSIVNCKKCGAPFDKVLYAEWLQNGGNNMNNKKNGTTTVVTQAPATPKKRRFGGWLIPITGLLVIIVLILLTLICRPWNWNKNRTINGDLHVKGSIIVDKDATIKGDLSADKIRANVVTADEGNFNEVNTVVLNANVGNFNTVNTDVLNANTGNIGTINTEQVNIVPDIPKVVVPTVAPVVITPIPAIHTANPTPAPTTTNNIISFEFGGYYTAECDGVISGDVVVNDVRMYDLNNESTFLVIRVKKGDVIYADPVWKAWFSNYSYEYVVNSVQTAHPTWTQQ